MLVFAKFAFDFDLEFFYLCSITPQKSTYLYQEFDFISSWFRPMEKAVIMRQGEVPLQSYLGVNFRQPTFNDVMMFGYTFHLRNFGKVRRLARFLHF